MLDILATDPAHMRRGAGKMLMKFGTDIADQNGTTLLPRRQPGGSRPLSCKWILRLSIGSGSIWQSIKTAVSTPGKDTRDRNE
jgi:hypothetical protein